MENFVKFIVEYIENKEIHGCKGWIDQLYGYRWSTKSGIDRFSDGIQRSKDFKLKTQRILSSQENDENWCSHCNEVAVWGGMRQISSGLAKEYRNSVIFLSNNDLGIQSNFKTLPINGERIAMASKIYYFSDPLRWTIYDSRVGYAIHQLIFEYSKNIGVAPSTLFQNIPFCLPESQTDRRVPVFPVSKCYGYEINAKASFIWASYLHRLIAVALNQTSIPKPDYCFSALPQWELPHVEMVFFMIGDRNWISPKISQVDDASSNSLKKITKDTDSPIMPLSGVGQPISCVSTDNGRFVKWGKTRFDLPDSMINDIINNFFRNNQKWYYLGASMDNPIHGGLGEFISKKYSMLTPRHASAIAAIMVHDNLIDFKGERPILLRMII